VNEKLQQILRMLENVPEPGPSSKANVTERDSCPLRSMLSIRH
jgi:hypothetical protein